MHPYMLARALTLSSMKREVARAIRSRSSVLGEMGSSSPKTHWHTGHFADPLCCSLRRHSTQPLCPVCTLAHAFPLCLSTCWMWVHVRNPQVCMQRCGHVYTYVCPWPHTLALPQRACFIAHATGVYIFSSVQGWWNVKWTRSECRCAVRCLQACAHGVQGVWDAR